MELVAHGPGQTVGSRYELREPLGQGGMGVVWRAHDPRLDREVALKLLRPAAGHGSSGGPAEARLLREARAMAQLAHPNIVAIFDVGHERGTVHLAMEIVEGVTLKQWLAEGPHPLAEVARVLAQAGRGLVAAHAAGLVHRDFKPSNVVVGHDGRVRVLDFGLAATTSVASQTGTTGESEAVAIDRSGDGLALDRLTQTGVVMGTPAYMAPEQHRGAPPDARSDQFSFAVVLFEALYGRRPYAKTAVDGVDADIAQARMPEPAAGARPPRRLERALARALARAPQDRFATIRPLVEALADDTHDRGAGRRMAFALGGGVALVGSLAWASIERPDTCRDDARVLQQTLFGVERREAIAAAFDTPRAPYAAATWQRIEPRLSAYVHGWTTAMVDACHAEAAPTDSRTRCLEARREDLTTLLALLERGEPGTLRRAAALTASLAPVADCARTQEQIETDPEIAELLRRSSLLENAGELDEAKTVADEALARAEASEDPRAIADAEYRRGRIFMDTGDFEAARDALARAYHTAAPVEYDERMALAAIDLIEVVGGLLRDEDGGREWIGHARAATARLGDEVMRARLLNNIGLFHFEFGRFDEAATATRRAREIRDEYLPPNHTDAISSLGNLAGIYVETGRYDEAIALQEEVIERRRQLHGDDHPEVATALSNYATTFFERRHLERSAELHREALALRERVLPAQHLDIASSLVNLGAVVGEQGDFEQARALYERALKIREAHLPADHPDLVGTYGDLGIAYSRAGEYDQARRYMKRALEAQIESLGPDHPTVGRSWANLGIVEQLDDDLPAADEAYGNALRIFETALGPDNPYVAMVLNNLAAVKLKRDQFATARPMYERALAVHEAGPTGDNPVLAVILTGLGRSQLGEDEVDAAIATLDRARMVAERTKLEPRLRAETYLASAMAGWARGRKADRARARELADRAHDLAASLGPAEADLVGEIDRWRAEHRL